MIGRSNQSVDQSRERVKPEPFGARREVQYGCRVYLHLVPLAVAPRDFRKIKMES